MSRLRYRTVSAEGRSELIEKRSRFIGICRPLATEAAADDFIRDIKMEFPDARHHVYAWILGGDTIMQRFSDAGEPKGTAGLPLLETLRKADVDQAGIVVVRYFGGVLLGAAGLTRAYGKTAALALQQAEPVTLQACRKYQIDAAYSEAERIRYALTRAGYWQDEPVYGAEVSWSVAAARDQTEVLLTLLTDLSAGELEPVEAGEFYLPLPPEEPPPE